MGAASHVQQMPPLQPGETMVQSFRAPVGAAGTAAAPPAFLGVRSDSESDSSADSIAATADAATVASDSPPRTLTVPVHTGLPSAAPPRTFGWQKHSQEFQRWRRQLEEEEVTPSAQTHQRLVEMPVQYRSPESELEPAGLLQSNLGEMRLDAAEPGRRQE